MNYKGNSLWFYGKRLIKEIGEDDLSGAASELAYKFFLAIFPFFIFLAAMGGFAADLFGVKNPTQQVMDWLGNSLPSDASSVFRTQLQAIIEQRNPALLSVGIVGAIWAAASGLGTVMKCMNRVYEVRETRPFWKRYALSIVLTLLGAGFLVSAFALLVVGQVQGLEIARSLGMGGVASHAFTLARWPVVVALILAAIAFLYWAAPNVKLPFQWISPGAIIFTISWLVASYLFGLYVANFGSYNATYGALGGIVILLFWFYITAFMMLLGAEVNSILAQELAPQELPQTFAQGATPETVPAHRKAEAAAKAPDASHPAAEGPSARRQPRPADGPSASAGPAFPATSATVTPTSGEAPHQAPHSSVVALAGFLVAAVTFWKFARPHAGRAQTTG